MAVPSRSLLDRRLANSARIFNSHNCVGRSATMTETLAELLRARFGAAPDVPPEAAASATLVGMARHRTIRSYAPRPVAPDLVRTLAAVALSAPSKSDLQQCDIVIVENSAQR